MTCWNIECAFQFGLLLNRQRSLRVRSSEDIIGLDQIADSISKSLKTAGLPYFSGRFYFTLHHSLHFGRDGQGEWHVVIPPCVVMTTQFNGSWRKLRNGLFNESVFFHNIDTLYARESALIVQDKMSGPLALKREPLKFIIYMYHITIWQSINV